jgi:hypothetical protein
MAAGRAQAEQDETGDATGAEADFNAPAAEAPKRSGEVP